MGKKNKKKKTASGKKQSFSKKDEAKFDKLMKEYLETRVRAKF